MVGWMALRSSGRQESSLLLWVGGARKATDSQDVAERVEGHSCGPRAGILSPSSS